MNSYSRTGFLYELFLKHPVITTDSRNVPSGSIFFALKGEQHNGNHYAMEALDRGAAWAVVDDPSMDGNHRCVFVNDSLLELQQLGLHHRKQFSIPVIAVTGSNGKTTTKELISHVLGQKFRVSSTRGNLNNHIGVPLTLLKWTASTELAIVEMGANHPGEIDFLCSLAQPSFGIITNIGKAHLEGFGNIENVRKTKAELYRWLEKKGGYVFRNSAEASLHPLPFPDDRTIFFGIPDNEVWAETLASGPFLRLQCHIGKDSPFLINTRLAGSYNLHNVLTAIAVGLYFKVPLRKIIQAIEAYTPANNRSEIIDYGRYRLFFDAYNANPTSMFAALKDFLASTAKSKVLILGDMLELGKYSETEHRTILKYLVKENPGKIFLVGPLFSGVNEDKNIPAFPDTEALMTYLEKNMPGPSYVFVKGSRKIQLEKLKQLFETLSD